MLPSFSCIPPSTGRHDPSLGTQGPTSSASSHATLTLGQMSLLTNLCLPFKTVYSSSGLNRPLKTSLTFSSQLPTPCTHLYPTTSLYGNFYLYLTMSILRTNILSFIHTCRQVASTTILGFFLISRETRKN